MKKRIFTLLSPALYCLMSLLACTLVQANNLPPVAVIDLWPDKAVYYHGETIALYGEASYVQSNGYIMFYQWYINNELKLEGSNEMNYDHTVDMTGHGQQPLTIRLRVLHSNGKWGEQTITRTEKQKPGQHYYLTDHLGSVRATVDAIGTLIGWDDFFPFGMVMPGRSSNTANPNDLYKYTGHERDPEAGLEIDFMNARTYDSEIGRFLQKDPLAGEFPSWSPYSYAFNNPLIFADPTGKFPVCDNCDETYKVGSIVENRFGEWEYIGDNQWRDLNNGMEIGSEVGQQFVEGMESGLTDFNIYPNQDIAVSSLRPNLNFWRGLGSTFTIRGGYNVNTVSGSETTLTFSGAMVSQLEADFGGNIEVSSDGVVYARSYFRRSQNEIWDNKTRPLGGASIVLPRNGKISTTVTGSLSEKQNRGSTSTSRAALNLNYYRVLLK